MLEAVPQIKHLPGNQSSTEKQTLLSDTTESRDQADASVRSITELPVNGPIPSFAMLTWV